MAGKNYSHQLDAKNRMRIPAKLKEEIGEGYAIMVGAGGCLSVLTKKESDEMIEKLSKVSRFAPEAQNYIRKVMATHWDAVEDNQGRILIPEIIRKKAKIQKNIVILKNLSGIEIWAEEEWDKFINQEEDYDTMLAKLDTLMQEVE